jgi:hypothetical protein
MENANLLLVGDFNYSDIDWTRWNSGNTQSNKFLDILRDNMLIQHVELPTRVRGSDTDTPHLLDLVITNDSFVESIYHLARKSDRSVLLVSCDLTGQRKVIEDR